MVDTFIVGIFLALGLAGLGVNLYISISVLKRASDRTIFDLGKWQLLKRRKTLINILLGFITKVKETIFVCLI